MVLRQLVLPVFEGIRESVLLAVLARCRLLRVRDPDPVLRAAVREVRIAYA